MDDKIYNRTAVCSLEPRSDIAASLYPLHVRGGGWLCITDDTRLQQSGITPVVRDETGTPGSWKVGDEKN